MLLIVHIFVIGFLLNLVWHLPHSLLYETCYKVSLKRFVWLNIQMPLKDGFIIVLFYLLSVLLFKNQFILKNPLQLGFFVLLSIGFAYGIEKISLRLKRWEYTKYMPLIFGVGLTPLIEIATTGTATFIYIFWNI